LAVDPASIRLNQGIPAEKFTIVFPPGCEVYNEVTGKRYIVGEISEQEASLSEEDWQQRMAKLSPSELIDILGTASLSMQRTKWFAALRRLVEIGPAAVPTLGEALRRTDVPQFQSKLAFALRALGDPNGVPALIDGLERSGDCSDYGLGDPKTPLDRFYLQHQIDPSGGELMLGRPVREITIALETLTGHSEGHDHFDMYSASGKRLGSVTITGEFTEQEVEVLVKNLREGMQK
jgi:hypothetical protein